MKFQLQLTPISNTAPGWWLCSSSQKFRHLSWAHVVSAIGLIVVSSPFALAIAIFSKRTAFRISVYTIILYFLIAPIAYLPLSWENQNAVQYATWIAAIVKQLLFLPTLTCLFSKLLRELFPKAYKMQL